MRLAVNTLLCFFLSSIGIEETVSALSLPEEVAQGINDWDRLSALDRSILESTGQIALEEGNHSALAWQTIQWICETEVPACQAIEEMITKSLHKTAIKSISVDRAWKQLVTSVVPYVLRGKMTPHALTIQCNNGNIPSPPLSTLNAEMLAERILKRVLCNGRDTASLDSTSSM